MLKITKIHISTQDNVISDLKKSGDTYLTVYLKDSQIVYKGYLYLHRLEKNEEQVIVLEKYSVCKLDQYGFLEEDEVEDFFDKPSRRIILKYKDIQKIEVCYPKEEAKNNEDSNEECIETNSIDEKTYTLTIRELK